jgi:hypothetical protein
LARRLRISAWIETSRAEVGSSNSRTGGLRMSAELWQRVGADRRKLMRIAEPVAGRRPTSAIAALTFSPMPPTWISRVHAGYRRRSGGVQ